MEEGTTLMQSLNAVDRVRANTAKGVNETLDRELQARLMAFALLPGDEIAGRIRELEKEWDIERSIDVQAAVTALLSIWLAYKVNWKWIWLAVINQGFLLEHSLQGWCPPVALHRAFLRRTRREIDVEILALRLLRGDFGTISGATPEARVREALRLAVMR